MSLKALFQIALTVIAAASLAGCFEPIQSGGVVIVGDPSERLGVLCRFRQRDAGPDAFCAPDAQEAAQVSFESAEPAAAPAE